MLRQLAVPSAVSVSDDPPVARFSVQAAAGAVGRWATAGPAWSLPAYLLIGLFLRVPAVVWADGFDFPDQQFQYVDPAWHLATGQGWHRTWEWIDGARSWLYPGMLAGVFRSLLWLGVDEPMALMRAVRGVHAVASLLPLWLFWLAVVRWNRLVAPRLPLLLFAGSGWLIGSGVQPSGPALGATLAVAAALAVHGPRWLPVLGGLCLGLAFGCRAQEALFGPALVAVLLWQRRYGAATAFAFACLPGVALQGYVDLRTHGRFLGSVWTYIETNLVLGSAGKWSEQPWWFYIAAGVVPTVASVPPFLRVAWQCTVAGARLLPGVAFAALLHLAVHSCIARKALRFEHASFAMLVAVVAIGLCTVRTAAKNRVVDWHRRLLLAVHGVLWLQASLSFGNAGAVRAALAMHDEPGIGGRILVVGGDATSIGGFYYLRVDRDRVEGVARAALGPLLAAAPPRTGELVVSVRYPLEADVIEPLGHLELVGAWTGQFDLRTGDRRFVYRWR